MNGLKRAEEYPVQSTQYSYLRRGHPSSAFNSIVITETYIPYRMTENLFIYYHDKLTLNEALRLLVKRYPKKRKESRKLRMPPTTSFSIAYNTGNP